MSDREHAGKLLKAAEGDLNAIRGMLDPSLVDANYFSDEVFGFHCQQAVEKSLKAWLAFRAVSWRTRTT